MKPAFQLLGQRFGRLVVKERQVNRKGYTWWSCLCDCGNETAVSGVGLMNGHTRSCGCLHAEIRRICSTTHGARHTGAYESWAHMIQRCENPKNKDFARYGGRGVKVCERWKNFVHFLADMGERPIGLTIDRIDNLGNYEKDNCRWADRLTQGRNRLCVRASA